jgi:hypothetical protein
MKKIFNIAAIAAVALAVAGCDTDSSMYSGQTYNTTPSDTADNAPAVVVETVPVFVPEEPNVVVVDPSEREARRATVESPARVVPQPRPENVMPRPFRKPY